MTLPLPSSTIKLLEQLMPLEFQLYKTLRCCGMGNGMSTKSRRRLRHSTIARYEHGVPPQTLMESNALKGEGDSPWASYMNQRYLKSNPVWHSKTAKSGSCIWKRIQKEGSILRSNIKWQVGDGTKISLWNDIWLKDQPLSTSFPSFVSDETTKVSMLISEAENAHPI
ncbi:hypothetical protein MRB53_036580 [Persea americana]|nr:hypothetical protein MRB53_036762 [Persea americana]KAJ8614382.1 hypothetical protein MRB53_036580 [Persea americana]